MANTTWSGVNLNDVTIAQNMIRGFVSTIAPLSIFSTNFSEDLGAKGETVYVPLDASSVGSVQTKSIATAYTIGDATASSRTVTLGSPKYYAWGLDDVEVSKSSVLNLSMFGYRRGAALAKSVLQDIWSQVTAANYGTAAFTGATSGFDEDDIADIAKVCDDADWSGEGRYLVLGNAAIQNLRKSGAIKNVSAYGYAEIQNGMIPEVHGFKIIQSNCVPGNSENLFGFACTSDAMAVAMRYLQPNDDGKTMITAQPLTYFNGDGESTGITLGYREWYSGDSGTRKAAIEALYGYTLGNTAALKRLVTA